MGGGVSKTNPTSKAAETLFKDIDKNSDAQLSIQELTSAAERHGARTKTAWPEPRIREVLLQHDKNKDGMLNMAEWKAALSSLEGEGQKRAKVSTARAAAPTKPRVATAAKPRAAVAAKPRAPTQTLVITHTHCYEHHRVNESSNKSERPQRLEWILSSLAALKEE